MAASNVPSDPPPEYSAAAEQDLPVRPAPLVQKPPPQLELPILTYLKSKRVILT